MTNSWSRIFLMAASLGTMLALPGTAAVTAAVASPPVGIVNLQAASGATSALSLPLEPSPAYAGVVASVEKRTLTWKGKGWQQRSAASYQSAPFAVKMTSGKGLGLAFPIVSGGANDLRLDTTADLAAQISKGDKFEILPVDTLASIFGADGAGLQTNADPEHADNVQLLKNGKWETYYHDGKNWSLAGDSSRVSRNSVVIQPGEGFLFLRRGSAPLSLQVTGDVPANPKIRLPRGVARALLGDPFTSSRRLVDLGLPGPQNGYSVVVYGSGDPQTYFFRKGGWTTADGDGGSRLGPRLPVGTAVLVERLSTGR